MKKSKFKKPSPLHSPCLFSCPNIFEPHSLALLSFLYTFSALHLHSGKAKSQKLLP